MANRVSRSWKSHLHSKAQLNDIVNPCSKIGKYKGKIVGKKVKAVLVVWQNSYTINVL